MHPTGGRSCQILTALLVLCLSGSATAAGAGAPPSYYKNYTVGDSLGWYDRLENPKVDYQKWAASKTFHLGDTLIFNTDNNHSVIQTYNATSYQNCDDQDSAINDTISWVSADPSSTSPRPVSANVPLVKQGINYFFSDDYDGEQCKNGLQLAINVTYGRGLPVEAPAPYNPDLNNEDSAPDTIVPSNFNHPLNVSDDDGNEASKSPTAPSGFSEVTLIIGILILLGLYGIV